MVGYDVKMVVDPPRHLWHPCSTVLVTQTDSLGSVGGVLLNEAVSVTGYEGRYVVDPPEQALQVSVMISVTDFVA
jgi:hypothetical protein